MGCPTTVARPPSGNGRAPLGFDHVDSAREAGRADVEDDGAPALPTAPRTGRPWCAPSSARGGSPPAPRAGPTPTDPRGSTERHMTSQTTPATDDATQATQPEAPAEAATDTPTGSPRQPHPTLPDGFTDLDRRAIDTARVLAMDAVQKVGNGHPGTAMSMAPTAYLLFQKWLRHDPSDAQWTGRDRFVLSMGHSSLTLYIQLYLSGYGLELADLQALRTWGSRTPRPPPPPPPPRPPPPPPGPSAPAGRGRRGGRPPPAPPPPPRRERGLFDPD